MNLYLSFKGDCEAAFKFYEQCLGGQPQDDLPTGARPWRIRSRRRRSAPNEKVSSAYTSWSTKGRHALQLASAPSPSTKVGQWWLKV
jgi:uncharacterized glyoxalase superfamily protein PhnB